MRPAVDTPTLTAGALHRLDSALIREEMERDLVLLGPPPDDDPDPDPTVELTREWRLTIRHETLRRRRRFLVPFTLKDDVTEDALTGSHGSRTMAASPIDYRGRRRTP
jgi:hypothetical protein